MKKNCRDSYMNHVALMFKAYFICLACIAACLFLPLLTRGCCDVAPPSAIKSDTVYVVKTVLQRDTIPMEKVVRVAEKVQIPVVKTVILQDSCRNDIECVDSVEFPLVQKEYSDDSTYTAYVSGLQYGSYPKLDSVIVRHRLMERTITNSVERRVLKFKLRPAVGGGYDPLRKDCGVYFGLAVVLDW